MNPNVPEWKDLGDYVRSLNSMFAYVMFSNKEVVFTRELQHLFLCDFLTLDDPFDFFSFCTISVGPYNLKEQAIINLIETMEERIELMMSKPRDTSKAVLIWRCLPEIEYYPNSLSGRYSGYARFKVLDKNSKPQKNYYEDPIKGD